MLLSLVSWLPSQPAGIGILSIRINSSASNEPTYGPAAFPLPSLWKLAPLLRSFFSQSIPMPTAVRTAKTRRRRRKIGEPTLLFPLGFAEHPSKLYLLRASGARVKAKHRRSCSPRLDKVVLPGTFQPAVLERLALCFQQVSLHGMDGMRS
ncbi:hypothetical protein LY76DRAFT_594378 [Colletotrichum caudatum]|nr:hypothetical protein LY76DRAFT_594378 [Colletotrichum caudatum]